MKKISMIVLSFMFLFILTGCGSGKKLKCNLDTPTSYDEIESAGYEVTFEFDKDGKKFKKFTEISYAVYSSSVSDEVLSEAYTILEEMCDEYNKYEGVTCKEKKNGYKMSATQTINLSKAKEDILKEFYLDGFLNKTSDEIKKLIEDAGYTCK